MHDKHKGSLNEYKAIVWLMSKGYEVYSNTSTHGPIDLIAVDIIKNETLLLDVKSGYIDNKGILCSISSLTKEQITRGVKLLVICGDRIDIRDTKYTCCICSNPIPKRQDQVCSDECKSKLCESTKLINSFKKS